MVLALLHWDLGDQDSDSGSEAHFLYSPPSFCEIIVLLTLRPSKERKGTYHF